MDLNKIADWLMSQDAKVLGGLASSLQAPVKAEEMDHSGTSSLVAPPCKGMGSPKKSSASVLDRLCRSESYCLFIQGQKDGDMTLSKDLLIDLLA